MANSTYSTLSFSSKGKSNNTAVHPREHASYHNHDTGNNRNYRPRGIWRYLQQLVRYQRSTQWKHCRSEHNLLSTHSRRAISTRDCDKASRSSRTDRHRSSYYNKLHYYLALGILSISNPAMAEVYNNAAPTSTATGNVTNQAVQFQNNGAPSRQNYGSGISCNGATMTFSPFYMGNHINPYSEKENMEGLYPSSYQLNENWGFQVNFMVPLDRKGLQQCRRIAKRQEEKMRLDHELVRALKCAELQQKGFTFRPETRVAHLCSDVVPIQALLPPKPQKKRFWQR